MRVHRATVIGAIERCDVTETRTHVVTGMRVHRVNIGVIGW